MDLDIKKFMYINLLLTVTGLVPVITASRELTISGPDEVVAGVSSLFTCSATCSSDCFYTWSVEDQTFNGNTLNLTASGLNRYETVICSVVKDNVPYAIESKLVKVNNPYAVKPNPIKMPKLGDIFELTCNGANPPATISWLKDGNPLKLDSRMSLFSDNKRLIFKTLEEADAGKYQCKVVNGNVGVVSVNFRMEFLTETVIVSIRGPTRVELGLENEFICNATCSMSCTANWSVQSDLPKGQFNTVGQRILWTPSELGQTYTFTCIALSLSAKKLGQVTKTVTVVEALPHPKPNDAASVRSSVTVVSSAALLMLVSAYI